MIEIFCQIKNGKLIPASREYAEELKAYKDNQFVRCVITGSRKARSVQQNKYIHAIFRMVAGNTDDPDWDTPEKTKRMVKLKMKFFKNDVVVHGNKVYFELRSFAFDRMEAQEANIRYNDALLICSKFLKVDPSVLEVEAQHGD